MAFEEVDVSPVGLVGNIEDVSHKGDQANQPVDEDIEQHARDYALRRAQAARFGHEVERDQGCCGITDAGYQADDTFNPEPDICTRDSKAIIEPMRQTVKKRRFLTSFGFVHFLAMTQTACTTPGM